MPEFPDFDLGGIVDLAIEQAGFFLEMFWPLVAVFAALSIIAWVVTQVRVLLGPRVSEADGLAVDGDGDEAEMKRSEREYYHSIGRGEEYDNA